MTCSINGRPPKIADRRCREWELCALENRNLEPLKVIAIHRVSGVSVGNAGRDDADLKSNATLCKA
jgi:hypothetical protein